jgi:hypothetical protein
MYLSSRLCLECHFIAVLNQLLNFQSPVLNLPDRLRIVLGFGMHQLPPQLHNGERDLREMPEKLHRQLQSEQHHQLHRLRTGILHPAQCELQTMPHWMHRVHLGNLVHELRFRLHSQQLFGQPDMHRTVPVPMRHLHNQHQMPDLHCRLLCSGEQMHPQLNMQSLCLQNMP